MHVVAASDAIAVAAVHATIIAIFTAITVAYFGVIFGRSHTLGNEIIDRANAIGRDTVTLNISPDEERFGPNYDGRDQGARIQIQANVLNIAMDAPAYLYAEIEDGKKWPLDERVPPQGQSAERGEYLVSALSALLQTYPLHGETLTSTRAVRLWLDDVRTTMQTPSRVVTFLPYVESLIQATETKRQEDQAAAPIPGAPASATQAFREHFDRVMNPRYAFDMFMRKFSEIAERIGSVDAELARYENYESRGFAPRRARPVFAATALAFVTGVLLPLIDTHTPRWVYVGVPCAVYIIGIITAAAYLWRNSAQRHDGQATTAPPVQSDAHQGRGARLRRSLGVKISSLVRAVKARW